MFYLDGVGLIISHTPEQWERLERGEAYSCYSESECYKIVGWMELGRDVTKYPKYKITRQQGAAIFCAYKSGRI